MEIIKNHYEVSRPVEGWDDIKEQAGELRKFVDVGPFIGNYQEALAISHCQVSEDPWHFFCVNSKLVEKKMFPHQVIINAKFEADNIIKVPVFSPTGKWPVRKGVDLGEGETCNECHEQFCTCPERLDGTWENTLPVEEREVQEYADFDNVHRMYEACMSFPYRKEKQVDRFRRITVTYQYPKTSLLGKVTLEEVTEVVEGLKSQMFQHECEHAQGKNIIHTS